MSANSSEREAEMRRCACCLRCENWKWWPAVDRARARPMACDPLTLDEGQQVRVDGLGLCRRHAVRKTPVGFQGAILQKFGRQRSGGRVRNDLVVVAMHYQDRYVDHFQIFGEVGLGEGDDTVVMRFRATHHTLPPPVQDHGLQWLSFRPVEAVERARSEVEV